MVIEFSLQSLLILLASAIAITAGILLISILWDLKKVARNLGGIAETNKESINKTISTMPEIFENVGQITSNVRETTEKLKVSVPVILQEVACATNAAKESIVLASAVIENMGSGINEAAVTFKKDPPGFMSYFRIIEEVVQLVYRTFSSGK